MTKFLAIRAHLKSLSFYTCRVYIGASQGFAWKKILDGLFYFEYLMYLMWCLLNLEIELMLITSQHWLIMSSRNDTNHTKVRKRRKIVAFTVYGFETKFFTVYCFEGLNFTVYCFGDPPLHPLIQGKSRGFKSKTSLYGEI